MKLLGLSFLTLYCVRSSVSLQRRPNVLINQIVRHFSHLFQVKSIEGVLPKINVRPLLAHRMIVSELTVRVFCSALTGNLFARE